MISNIKQYEKELDKLIELGGTLYDAMVIDYAKDKYPEIYEEVIFLLQGKKVPRFEHVYQSWYSESLILIKLLLPDRIHDFVKQYEIPKSRKYDEIRSINYTIEDALLGVTKLNYQKEEIIFPAMAIQKFLQQLFILRSVKSRFSSSLFDIKLLLSADLFDSELDSARELNKKGFTRAAGAVAGVVLEKHLAQVCENHKIKISKKNPSISVYNDKLKEADVYPIPIFRKIQQLGDLRNLCDHPKEADPSKEDIDELISGTDKIIKSVF